MAQNHKAIIEEKKAQDSDVCRWIEAILKRQSLRCKSKHVGEPTPLKIEAFKMGLRTSVKEKAKAKTLRTLREGRFKRLCEAWSFVLREIEVS